MYTVCRQQRAGKCGGEGDCSRSNGAERAVYAVCAEKGGRHRPGEIHPGPAEDEGGYRWSDG